jgi:protein required for attachment to host cells
VGDQRGELHSPLWKPHRLKTCDKLQDLVIIFFLKAGAYMLNTHWILVANGSEARIFSTDKIFDGQNWQLIKEFDHPESRERDLDLVTDKPGRYQFQSKSGTSGHGAYSEHTEPREVEVERFARQLAEELNGGRVHNLYHQLILIAPPHLHGLLNKYCESNVLNLITHHVEKDYTKLKQRELAMYLKEM